MFHCMYVCVCVCVHACVCDCMCKCVSVSSCDCVNIFLVHMYMYIPPHSVHTYSLCCCINCICTVNVCCCHIRMLWPTLVPLTCGGLCTLSRCWHLPTRGRVQWAWPTSRRSHLGTCSSSLMVTSQRRRPLCLPSGTMSARLGCSRLVLGRSLGYVHNCLSVQLHICVWFASLFVCPYIPCCVCLYIPLSLSPPSLSFLPLSSFSLLSPSLLLLSSISFPLPLSHPPFRSAPNHHFLKSMARTGGGAAEYFDSKTKSKWERKVKAQLSKAFQPALTSVSVDWQVFDESSQIVQVRECGGRSHPVFLNGGYPSAVSVSYLYQLSPSAVCISCDLLISAVS